MARGDVVEIVAPGPAAGNDPANATATFRATALGDWGNDVQAQIRPMVGATMSILPSPTAGALAITTLQRGRRRGTTAQVVVPVTAGTFDTSIDNQTVVIAGQRFQASGAAVNGSQLTFTITPAQHAAWQTGLSVQRLRTAMLSGATPSCRSTALRSCTSAPSSNWTTGPARSSARSRPSPGRGDLRRRPDRSLRRDRLAQGRRGRGAGQLPAGRRPADRGGLHQPADRGCGHRPRQGPEQPVGRGQRPVSAGDPGARSRLLHRSRRSSRPPARTVAG